ncbi:hypothetical protein V2G26_007394 [Clonostachys chloroleuca]
MATQQQISHRVVFRELQNIFFQPLAINSIPTRCAKHPGRIKHSQIQEVYGHEVRCPFCRLDWARPLDLDTNFSPPPPPPRQPHPASSSRASSSPALNIPHQSPGPNFSRSSPSSRSSTPASTRGERLHMFTNSVHEATAQTRGATDHPLDNPVGLRLRIKPLHSEGFLLSAGLFKAMKLTPLDIIDLPLIPWDRAKRLGKDSLLDDFLSTSLTLESFDKSLIQFGTRWDKAPRAEAGTLFTITSDKCPFEGKDIFSRRNDFQWQIEEKRLVLWVDLRIVTEKPVSQKKPRAAAKPRKPAASREIKKERVLELDLNAFPPREVITEDEEEIEVDGFSINEEDEEEEEEEEDEQQQLQEASVEAAVEIAVESDEREAQERRPENTTESPDRQVSRKRQRALTSDSNNHHEDRSHSRAGRLRKASAKLRND